MGRTGRVKNTRAGDFASLNNGILCDLCEQGACACNTSRHVPVCFGPLFGDPSERMYGAVSHQARGRCKKCINTQLGVRGYSSPSHRKKATA